MDGPIWCSFWNIAFPNGDRRTAQHTGLLNTRLTPFEMPFLLKTAAHPFFLSEPAFKATLSIYSMSLDIHPFLHVKHKFDKQRWNKSSIVSPLSKMHPTGWQVPCILTVLAALFLALGCLPALLRCLETCVFVEVYIYDSLSLLSVTCYHPLRFIALRGLALSIHITETETEVNIKILSGESAPAFSR